MVLILQLLESSSHIMHLFKLLKLLMDRLYSSLVYALTLTLLVFTSACQNKQSESEQDNFYSVEDFPTVEKIDAHVHLNVANPVVVNQGIEDNMKMITLNVANGRTPVAEQQRVALELQDEYSERLAYTSAFALDGFNDTETWQKNTLDYLAQSIENGAIGV